MTEEWQGVVKHIIFVNESTAYSVFRMEISELHESITVTETGHIPYIGEQIMIRGCRVTHPRFGMQFKADIIQTVKPEKSEEIYHFLASGMISGIGASMARKIVDYFGNDTLHVFEQQIERLMEIPGIGRKTLEKIKESYGRIGDMQELVFFLQSLGIHEKYAALIKQAYGKHVNEVLEEDPYRMVAEIMGLGFKNVDKMALAKGISIDNEERIVQGIFYILTTVIANGHTCGPAEKVYEAAAKLLGLDGERVRDIGEKGVESGEIPSAVYENQIYVYLPYLFEAETESAWRIKDMLDMESLSSVKLAVEHFEKENNMTLAPEQKAAVKTALESKVMVITGGPGTGKTTLIRAIISAMEQNGKEVKLMAPTGRAAKRLAISGGREADTIHKGLEAAMTKRGTTYFDKNESSPLDEDVIIVDEASMIDIALFYHLLCALKEGARLILVGDVDQLPPVGPGTPLKDLIAWGDVPVVTLKHVFRQKEGSAIIENAIRIRDGESCVPDEDGEFSVFYVEDDEEAYQTVLRICKDVEYVNDENKMNIQVLSPMYKGACGVSRLNEAIQEIAQGDNLQERGKFMVGDKVMQSVNDYDKGVYNGDMGIVWAVTDQRVFVRFLDREIVYEGAERNNLQLAYVVTVHKSQGSEYDTVIFVLRPSQFIMLQRNLLYTGVTRAKKNTILVTTEKALTRAISNYQSNKRYSLFLPFLKNEAR